MSLLAKQVEFTRCVGLLLDWAFVTGNEVVLAEAYRTREQAELYARAGKGILNSNHCKKLAVDLFRYKDGTVSWEFEDYRALGDYWKTLHPLARWGGDMPRLRDAVHFSFEHNGVI